MSRITKRTAQNLFWAWSEAFAKAGESDVDGDRDEYATLEAYGDWLAEAANQSNLTCIGMRTHKITTEVVAAVITYLSIDGRDDAVLKFLEQQRYVKSGEACPKYVFTFDMGDETYGPAILRGDDLSYIDLADLDGHPFQRLRRCGFMAFHISRADCGLLDLATLEREIKDDLLYDRDEDELEISCWSNDEETVLSMTVYERSAEEIEEERVRRLELKGPGSNIAVNQRN